MAITVEARSDLISIVVGMFNAAPGAAILSDLTVAFEAGQTRLQIATNLAKSAEYLSVFPEFMTNGEFATKLVDNMLGSLVNAAGKAEAVTLLTAKLNAANTSTPALKAAARADASVYALDLLKAVPTTDGTFGAAAAALANKVEVATFYSVNEQQNPATVLEAQEVIEDVDNTAASVTAAKAEISGDANQGQVVGLTVGADTVVGSSFDDTINAVPLNAAGTAADTFGAFDSIDGGNGTDTLNVYATAGNNNTFQTSASVKNVEIINLFNASTTANQQFGTTAAVDASKFVGATQVWQVGAANNNGLTNLAATTTAGLRNLTADDTVNTTVAATTTATSLSVALDAVKGKATTNVVTLGVSGDAVSTVNVSGTIAQQTVNLTASSLALAVTSGKDVETLTVNSAVKTTLTITEGTGSTKEVKAINASGSTGGITYAGTVAGGAVAPVSIKTGTGADDVTITAVTAKDTASTTTVDETISAIVETGAGNDKVNINTSGDGTTTVDTAAGNDEVTLTADGTGKLTVLLGAGNDSLTTAGAGAVSGTDLVDGGEGTDTLLLSIVGSANIGAFQNFEVFDAKGLAKTLDVDILASKNTVTEFVASGDVGAAAILTNLGAGVNFRATSDMGATNALTLTQKAAGALTITLDADSTSTTSQNDDTLRAVASNATSVKAVFASDSGFVQSGVNLNDQAMVITGTKATALEVVSGGNNATNTLTYTIGAASTATNGVLTSAVVSGDKALTLDFTLAGGVTTTKLASVDASALTGKLTFSTADLQAESAANTFDGGVVKLGTADDVITVTQGAKISGVELGSAEDLTTQSNFDVLTTGVAAQQAADVAATATLTIKDGLFTFNGAGPATLAAAVAAVDTQLTVDGDAVVFEYIGNSYVFINNDITTDIVVQLVGVTGLKGLDEVGTTDTLYVF